MTKRASGSTSYPATWTRPTYLILWVDSRRANLQAHGHTEHRCLLCLQLHAAQRAHASPRLPRKTSRLAKALHKALTNRRRQRGRMKLVSYIFYGQVFLRCFPGVQTAARCTRGRRWAKGGLVSFIRFKTSLSMTACQTRFTQSLLHVWHIFPDHCNTFFNRYCFLNLCNNLSVINYVIYFKAVWWNHTRSADSAPCWIELITAA